METPDMKGRVNTKSFDKMNANSAKKYEDAKIKEKEETLKRKEEELKKREEELKQKEDALKTANDAKVEDSSSNNYNVAEKYNMKKREPRKKTSLNLPESVFNKLITLSAQLNKTITNVVEDIISEEVKNTRINHEAVKKHYQAIEDRKNESEKKKTK